MDQSRRNLIAVTAAAFVGFTGFTLVMPFLALYVRQLGAIETADVALWTGLSLGVTPFIAAVCAPLWGRVGDRFGNKLLVQRSLLSFVVVMVLMAFVTRPWQVFVLRALQGLVGGYGPLTIAMAAMSAPPERMAQAIGTVQTAQRLAPTIGPLIGGALAPLLGLRRTFLVSGAVYGAAFLLMTALYREPPRPRSEAHQEQRVTFASILAFENFLVLLLVVFGLQLVDRSFGPVLPLYLGQLGYRTDQAAVLAGMLFSGLAASGALGNQLAARLLRRYSARAVIAASTLTASAALALFAASSAFWGLMATLLLFGAGCGTALTAAFTAAGAVIPRHAHGSGFGFLSSASLVASALSPVLSGLMAGRSVRLVFVSGAIGLALLAMGVRRIMVERGVPIASAPSIDET